MIKGPIISCTKNCPFCNLDQEYGYSCNLLHEDLWDITIKIEGYSACTQVKIPTQCPLRNLKQITIEEVIEIDLDERLFEEQFKK